MITDCALYQNGHRRPGRLPLPGAFATSRRRGAFVWIGLHDPTGDEFAALSREFRLHELAIEDALSPHQRPKLEVYDGVLFVVLRTARYADPTEVIEFGQVMVFVGRSFVITVRHGIATSLAPIRHELESAPDQLRCGPSIVLHAVMDRVVDDYVPVLAGVDNDVSEIEAQVFTSDSTNPTERIYKLKREVLEFHRATAPLLESVGRLVRAEYDGIVAAEVREYFRDVQDHLIRVVDEVNGFNSLLSSVLEANLAQVGVQQNQDMRRISAWVAIVAVPTMIAGIYGMNFDHMPELRWRYGYPAVVAVMAAACLFLYRRFRRSGWL